VLYNVECGANLNWLHERDDTVRMCGREGYWESVNLSVVSFVLRMCLEETKKGVCL